MNAPRTILALMLVLALSIPAAAQAIAVLIDALDLDEMASLELPGLGKVVGRRSGGTDELPNGRPQQPNKRRFELRNWRKGRTGTLGGWSFNEGERTEGQWWASLPVR